MHFAAASVIGSAHVNPGQPLKVNNQDAFAIRQLPNGYVFVLCDGCGSQPRSDIGADIGANIIARLIQQQILAYDRVNWENIALRAEESIWDEVQKFAADDSKESIERALIERFLFTCLVLIIKDDDAIIASLGDGVIIIDDALINITPPIFNAPPYIAYRLLRNTDYHKQGLQEHLDFVVQKEIKISELSKGLVIATDGLNDLNPEDLHHPALVQENTLSRWLNVQATETMVDGKLKNGICRDDTTIVIVRSDEAQNRLFESRKQISELKSKTAKLREKLHEFSSKLDRSPAKSDAESELAKLKAEFDLVSDECQKLEHLPNTIKEIREFLASLEERVSKIKLPVIHIKSVDGVTEIGYDYYHSWQPYTPSALPGKVSSPPSKRGLSKVIPIIRGKK